MNDRLISKEAKQIRRLIVEYIRNARKECGVDDFRDNPDAYDGFDLGVGVLLTLLKEVFYGVE